MSSSDSVVAAAAAAQPPNPALNPPPFIYRIVTRAEWQETFERNGRYCGSPLDHKDGFIHISSKEETAKTAALYYANQKDILLLQLDVQQVSQMHSARRRAAAQLSGCLVARVALPARGHESLMRSRHCV